MTCNQEHEGEIPMANLPLLPTAHRGKWDGVCPVCAYLLGRRHAAVTEERLWELVGDLQARVKRETVK
jgi:hypothetical protein